MADSLIIADTIELMGGGVPSTIADCAGAIFRLAPGFDLNSPQPTSEYVASLVTDGEVPVGERSSNRTIVLPIVIYIPAASPAAATDDLMRTTLIAAREVLSRAVSKQTWLLRWQREGSTLPTIFECFRATAMKPTYATWLEKQGFVQIELTFPAKPYGRSDVATTANFQSPLAGMLAPPSPVTIDAFSSVSGTQWSASALAPAGIGAGSAYWDPSAAPGNSPTGALTTIPPSGILNSNPDFAGPSSAGWTGFNGTVTATASPPGSPPPGLPSQTALVYTNNGVTSGAAEETAAPVACQPFESFLISGWIYSSVTTVAIGVDFTVNGAYNSTQIATYTVTANAWTWLSEVVTCPFPANGFYIRYGSSTLSAVIYGMHLTAQAAPGATYSRGNLALNLAAGYNFACAATGTTTTYIAASTNVVNVSVGDQFQIFTSGSPAQAQIFTVTAIAPASGGNQTVTFTPAAASAPGTSQSIVQTGPAQLPAVTAWAGFGSSNYYRNWALRGGPVHFLLTLTDVYGNTVASSRVDPLVRGSASNFNPRWVKIRIPVTYKPGFDYENVAGYTLSVTNRGQTLVFTQLYLAALTAVPPSTQVNTPIRGVVYDLAGMIGSARCSPSFAFQQAGTFVTNVVTFTTPGSGFWQAPFSIISLSNVFALGGAGAGPRGFAGGGGGGGSGGSSGFATSVAVTPGKVYAFVVGAGGVPGGAAPQATTFVGDAVTVNAPGGKNVAASTSTGATASAAGTPSGFAGGPGGAGVTGSTGGGGAGGGSAGSGAAGNAGGAASGSTGGTPGAAVAGGYQGGRGGTFNVGNGVQGNPGWGAASGGSPGGASGYFYPGVNGLLQLTYTTPPLFKTLLVHRPGTFTDPQFSPLLPIPPGDVQNGSIAYTIPQLTAGINARFGNGDGPGTFTVLLVVTSWNAPTLSRTLTVTVTLWEQQGGNSYPQSVSWSLIPNNLPNNSPFVVIGNLTIPAGTDLPADNTTAFYTASITDTNISDTIVDLVFLDTTGSTVMLQAPNSYTNMYIDEPVGTRDIGQILGSPSDRSAAVSLLSGVQAISGRPLTIDPYGNQSLLAYCVEGAPNMQMTYYPRWLFDRLS